MSNQSDIRPQIDNPSNIYLSSEEKTILEIMFASYQRVTIKQEFVGGLSSRRVLLVRPIESEHSPELPSVVKIAPIGLIKKEWQAFQDCVYQKLSGIAEITGEPVLPSDSQWGGLRYTLMGDGGAFEIESLHSYWHHAHTADIRYVVEERLFAITGPKWWSFNEAKADWPIQASYDFLLPVNLLIEPAVPPHGVSSYSLRSNALTDQSLSRGDYVRLEGFVVAEVDPQQKAVTLNVPTRADGLPASYRLRLQPVQQIETYQVDGVAPTIEGRVTETRDSQLQAIAREVLNYRLDLTADVLTSPDGTTLPNPLTGLPDLLGKMRNVRVSYIHGDLNLENILVEPAGRNVSLIDFATARRDHALHDLLRLETEVVTKLLPEFLAETDLLVETIRDFYRRLHQETFAPEQAASLPFSAGAGLVSTRALQADLEKPFEMLVVIRKMARQCLFDHDDWNEYYEGLTLYLLGALKFKNLDPLSKQVAFWTAAATCDLVEPVSLKGRLARKEWGRLQKYLPSEMYRERNETTCVSHLNQLLRAVVTYLPRHLALALLQEPVVAENWGHFLSGTLLFADISGFTAMSEELRRKGAKEGAEEITRVINEYLDVMLTILFKHKGRLIKFGGDAILCLFTGENQGAMNAMWAAWEMKQAMADHFDEIEVFQEMHTLDMKAGGNSGLLFAANVGTAEHMEYILTGSVVEHTARAESAAPRGDVLVSHETYDLVKDALEAENLAQRPDFYRVTDVRSEPVAESEASWSEVEKLLSIIGNDLWEVADRLDALSPYLPARVLPQLVYDPQGGQIEGQHRQVTVLFANFIGMSEIIHARGAKDVDGITADLSEYFEAMQEEIRYYGGVINKVDLYDQGDKLMAIFGAPVAHEQDTRRAALTALAMQEAMGRLSSPIASMLLSQRIGIHTGFVFAGNVGSSINNRREYTVMGDTVNLAARLMSATPRGKVWASQPAWDQIQASFEAKERPLVKAKGISDPITVYQLRAASGVQRDRDWSRVLRSDIVGREAELEALEMHFDDLLSGVGKLIVAITGEAGVGKTRLVEEWKQRACPECSRRVGEPVPSAAEGSASQRIKDGAVIWLGGRGHSYGQKTHGIFIEVLEQLLGFADDDAQKERWDKLAAWVRETFADAEPGWFDEFSSRLAFLGQFLSLDLSEKKGLAEQVTGLEAEALQLQTRLAICDLLEHAAQERPLILILEDLHWADDGSLDMLESVLDRVSDEAPLLFCLMYRPQKERSIWQTWQDIERAHPDCDALSLTELEETDGRRLLSNLLQTEQIAEDFQALILTETDGNPLYVEEVLHALIEDGTIVQQDGEWQVTRSVERIHVPDTLYQIIQSRIDELDFGSPGARRVLWMAAVIGEEFAEKLLLHLFTSTGRKKEEFSAHLRELRNAAMIERVRGRKQEAGSERQGAGGEGRGYRFRHGLVQQVAYENMLLEKRRAYHCAVGRWLEERYRQHLTEHYETLAYHYDQGQQWEKATHYHRLSGEKNAQVFANQDAIPHLQRALELSANPLAQADAHWLLGKVYDQWGKYDQALEELNRGLELAGQDPSVTRARLLVKRCSVSITTGKLAEAERDGLESLQIAQAMGARLEEAYAHNNLGAVYGSRGQYEQALECHQQGLAIRRELGVPYEISQSLVNVGTDFGYLGQLKEAQAYYQEALELQKRIGDRRYEGHTHHNLAWLHWDQKQLEDAEVKFSRALALWEKIDFRQGIAIVHNDLGTLYLEQGRLDEARDQLERSAQLYESMGANAYLPGNYNDLVQVYLESDQTEKALDAAQQALQWARQNKDRRQEAMASRMLGEAHLAGADLTQAEHHAQHSLDLAQADPPLPDHVQAATDLLEKICQAQASSELRG